jgi:hypothetical protein
MGTSREAMASYCQFSKRTVVAQGLPLLDNRGRIGDTSMQFNKVDRLMSARLAPFELH